MEAATLKIQTMYRGAQARKNVKLKKSQAKTSNSQSVVESKRNQQKLFNKQEEITGQMPTIVQEQDIEMNEPAVIREDGDDEGNISGR